MTETSEQILSKRRVIVVDDEQVIANTLAIILNQAGFEARAVLLEQARMQGYEFEILGKPVHPSDLLAKLRVSSIFYS
jgi:hypothetical protein